jgi:myosin tail region-interacting protein MTI1
VPELPPGSLSINPPIGSRLSSLSKHNLLPSTLKMSNPPFKVKAVFEYTSPHDDDLHFPNGQIITVTEEEDHDWYAGEYVDASGVKQEGIFPKNFVERYEPTAPPRPARTTRPKRDAELPAEPVPKAYELEAEPEPQPEPEPIHELPATREPPPSAPKPQAATSPPFSRPAEISPPPAAKPTASSLKTEPPPVSDKPSGGSFRDRIAAFNKAAPPVAPFKPGGLSSGGSNNFIKKPFVAPPPSKNAYVPVARDPPPQKIYRREEDPEIAAREKEDQELAERAGLAPTSNDGDEEEQPKPTSLKERIALLQKQQMEQASRHAEAAQKKEKPKRPPTKKRTESHGHTEGNEEGDAAPLESNVTGESAAKPSMDSVREEVEGPRKRKSSRGAVTTPGLHPRKSFGDGNEADMSGAGETTEEPEDMSTGRDDSDEKPRSRPPTIPMRAAAPPSRELDIGEEEGASEEEEPQREEDEGGEDEEDDIDPEVRRKEELRARMAKMSGGMGMHGMFGPAGGMPMPGLGAPPKKKKSTTSSDKRPTEYGTEETSPVSRAPPVPMPGLSRVRSPEELNKQLELEEEKTPISRSRPADELPDVEEVVPSKEGGAPPVPGGRPAPPPVPKECKSAKYPFAGYDPNFSSTTYSCCPDVSKCWIRIG